MLIDIITQQREYFNRGVTLGYNFRIQQLQKLRHALVTHKQEIVNALYQDLRRPELEAYFEIELVKEIDYVIKNLRSWMKVQYQLPTIAQMPAITYRVPQAIGNVLIISPWNYPFELTFRPLIGAIAAGNCIIIKPSEIALNSSQLINKIITSNFEPNYIAVVEGDATITQQLLQLRFDHIFFTGSTAVGKIIATAAAKNLTPTTLELGGKSPVIVCSDADIKLTAKRVLWGKLINAGQTCIAPDYVLVDRKIYPQLLLELKLVLKEFYPTTSNDLGRIISLQHWQRLVNLLESATVLAGGKTNQEELYIEPTLLKVNSRQDAIMNEEIFGPLLPIIPFDNLDTEIAYLKHQERPLALYLFSSNPNIHHYVSTQIVSGGMVINDCVLHISNHRMPFGGIGNSGHGAYHGKYTFDIFTHYKTVLKRFKFEIPWRYPPYNKLKLFLIKWLTKK